MTGLHSLDQAVDAINSGLAQRFLFKPFRAQQLVLIIRNASRTFLLERSHEQLLDELRRLNQDLEKRVAERTNELEVANKQLGQRNQMLQRMALTDALTSLPNRRVMERLAKNELIRRTRNPSPLSVAIIDIDYFKSINTRFLHSGGDHILTWFGQVLVNSVRTIDTVGRIGGEEFMVVAPDTDLQGAEILAERIRKKIEDAETIYQNSTIKITASIGMIVTDASSTLTYRDLYIQVSAALKVAKETGRNRSVVLPFSLVETPSESLKE
jgi:diguanylate cyclase (GGDEF)-like protein